MLNEALAYVKNKNKTNKDYFFKVFPNAPKGPWGYPTICVRKVGLKNDMEKCEHSCMNCWDKPHKGE